MRTLSLLALLLIITPLRAAENSMEEVVINLLKVGNKYTKETIIKQLGACDVEWNTTLETEDGISVGASDVYIYKNPEWQNRFGIGSTDSFTFLGGILVGFEIKTDRFPLYNGMIRVGESIESLKLLGFKPSQIEFTTDDKGRITSAVLNPDCKALLSKKRAGTLPKTAVIPHQSKALELNGFTLFSKCTIEQLKSHFGQPDSIENLDSDGYKILLLHYGQDEIEWMDGVFLGFKLSSDKFAFMQSIKVGDSVGKIISLGGEIKYKKSARVHEGEALGAYIAWSDSRFGKDYNVYFYHNDDGIIESIWLDYYNL